MRESSSARPRDGCAGLPGRLGDHSDSDHGAAVAQVVRRAESWRQMAPWTVVVPALLPQTGATVIILSISLRLTNLNLCLASRIRLPKCLIAMAEGLILIRLIASHRGHPISTEAMSRHYMQQYPIQRGGRHSL